MRLQDSSKMTALQLLYAAPRMDFPQNSLVIANLVQDLSHTVVPTQA